MSADSIDPPPTPPPAMPPDPTMPPITPGAYAGVPKAKSAWPTIIGVLAIVFGSGGALTGCWGVITPWFMPMLISFLESMPGAANASTADMMASFSPAWAVVMGLVTLGVALLLLFGGIALVKRRANSMRLCRWWAVLKMIFVVCNSIHAYTIMTATMQQAMTGVQAQSGGAAPAGLQTFVGIMAIVGIVFGVLWGWALPVFMLIWFSRRKVKLEVAEWTLNNAQPSSGLGA